MFDLVADGAQGVGYLLKEKVGDIRAFTDAVRRVAEGGSVLDPDVVARLVGRKRPASPLDGLTPRERQVMALIAEGRSNSGIASDLVVDRSRGRAPRDQHLRQTRAAPVARGASPGAGRAQVLAGRNSVLRSVATSSCLGTKAAAAQSFRTPAGTWRDPGRGQHDRRPRAGDGQRRRHREPVRTRQVDVQQDPVRARPWPRRPAPARRPRAIPSTSNPGSVSSSAASARNWRCRRRSGSCSPRCDSAGWLGRRDNRENPTIAVTGSG